MKSIDCSYKDIIGEMIDAYVLYVKGNDPENSAKVTINVLENVRKCVNAGIGWETKDIEKLSLIIQHFVKENGRMLPQYLCSVVYMLNGLRSSYTYNHVKDSFDMLACYVERVSEFLCLSKGHGGVLEGFYVPQPMVKDYHKLDDAPELFKGLLIRGMYDLNWYLWEVFKFNYTFMLRYDKHDGSFELNCEVCDMVLSSDEKGKIRILCLKTIEELRSNYVSFKEIHFRVGIPAYFVKYEASKEDRGVKNFYII